MVFAGGAKFRQWGTARPMIYSNHEPKPDPAWEIPISPTVDQARSARFQSHRPSARIGLRNPQLNFVFSSSCGSSSSRFRGHNRAR